MNLTRNIILLSGLGLSLALYAATGFEDDLVPGELVREFAGGEVYRDLPEGFPVPALPRDSGLAIIGSLDRGGRSQVLLRTVDSFEDAREMLREAYENGGWISLGENPASLSLCHDDYGTLEVRRAMRAGENRLHLILSPAFTNLPGTLSCAQRKALNEGQGGASGLSFLTELMPVLEVPQSTTLPPSPPRPSLAARGISSSFTGSGSFSMDQEGEVTVRNMNLAELYEHFAVQMEEQGWDEDSSAVGGSSVSSVWFKTARTPELPDMPGEDIDLTGMLSIVEADEDGFRVHFRLQGSGLPVFGSRGIVALPPSAATGSPPFNVLGPPLNAPELGIRGVPPSALGSPPAAALGIRGVPPIAID